MTSEMIDKAQKIGRTTPYEKMRQVIREEFNSVDYGTLCQLYTIAEMASEEANERDHRPLINGTRYGR